MSVFDVFSQLEELLPVLSGLTGHPEIGILAQRLINLGEEEVARRRAAQGRSRSEILADAAQTFVEAKAANQELKGLGHE